MGLGIVEKACKFDGGMERGVVVIESDQSDFPKAFHELGEGQAARRLAIDYANRQGMGGATLNGNTEGPYPVDAGGVPLDLLRDEHGEPLSQADPRMRPVRYRVSVPVSRSFR